ncbi:hypothetical protein [Caulobacter sp. S45]|uniref:hypothetical protein n=1 Tax=Caulobacter sp. S45 TaxID=1641861 RepID=UPI00131DAD16|nr:hypothetical protein [Caulobacter sp. S45]
MQRHWNNFIGLIKDFGEIAKFVALLLAIAGFVGLYFPTARTWFEMHTDPGAWYYIGAIKGGTFGSEPFQHPAWSGGSAPEAALDQLPGTTMVTLGSGLHIGRQGAGGAQPIRTNYAGGVCLRVTELKRTHDGQKPDAYIWARAVKITC